MQSAPAPVRGHPCRRPAHQEPDEQKASNNPVQPGLLLRIAFDQFSPYRCGCGQRARAGLRPTAGMAAFITRTGPARICRRCRTGCRPADATADRCAPVKLPVRTRCERSLSVTPPHFRLPCSATTADFGLPRTERGRGGRPGRTEGGAGRGIVARRGARQVCMGCAPRLGAGPRRDRHGGRYAGRCAAAGDASGGAGGRLRGAGRAAPADRQVWQWRADFRPGDRRRRDSRRRRGPARGHRQQFARNPPLVVPGKVADRLGHRCYRRAADFKQRRRWLRQWRRAADDRGGAWAGRPGAGGPQGERTDGADQPAGLPRIRPRRAVPRRIPAQHLDPVVRHRQVAAVAGHPFPAAAPRCQ